MNDRRAARVLLAWLVLSTSACGSSSAAGDGSGSSGSGGAGGGGGSGEGGGRGVGGSGAGAGGSGAGGGGSDGGGSGGSGTSTVALFQYRPSWSGVTQVDVIGGFGAPDDWMAAHPLTSLADDGTGTFRGSAALPAGQYLYVLRVVGDAASAMASKAPRFVLDPANAAFSPCPMASPTYSKDAPNPCSQLTVPQAPAATIQRVKGAITAGGQPAAGYLVVLERNEPMSHHFFVDRMTLGPDGAFDLGAAAGRYRLQVWHPTYLSVSDAKRDPLAEKALRRAISGAIDLSTDVAATAPDMAYGEYAAFAPTGPQTLPTHFTFGANAGAATRLAIYGSGASGEIGDPWYFSPKPVIVSADFDGTFNTAKATDPSAKPGTTYFWGTEEQAMAGSLSWTAQTMVFPITWK